jgi:hypothetical protein
MPRAADGWLRASLGLAIVHVVFLGLVSARVGFLAVVLWNVARPLLALMAAALLAVALVRAWRRREGPNARTLAGLAAIGLVIASLSVVRTYPSSYDTRPSTVPFRLPLEGPVTVAWGGATLAVNYHVVMADQRWAYDLLVTRDGRSFEGDGSRLEQYFAFDRPVLAPAGGVVRAVHDGEPDGPVGQWRVRRALGNHVILEVADGVFLFVAHFRQDSIAVTTGERVTAGQVLGRVGNSGNSSEPHVHLHLQDTPTAYFGEGIPFYFHDYRVRGEVITRGMPLGGRERRSRAFPGAFTGDIVEHVGASTEAQHRRLSRTFRGSVSLGRAGSRRSPPMTRARPQPVRRSRSPSATTAQSGQATGRRDVGRAESPLGRTHPGC